MSEPRSYIVQIGTRWDGSQNLIWAPLVAPDLQQNGLVVPDPRKYRRMIKRLTDDTSATGAADRFFVDSVLSPEGPQEAKVLLGVTSLIQPEKFFCPDGHWFLNLGARLKAFSELFAPATMHLMINPQSPERLLSEAWANEGYPGFKDTPPDPFQLHWSAVIEDIKAHNPDTHIVVCPSETGPVSWGLALQEIAGLTEPQTRALQLATALYDMSDEGKARLNTFLVDHPEMSFDLYCQTLKIFLKFYGNARLSAEENAIPNWTEAKDAQIKRHYAADLEAIAQIGDIFYWTGD